MKSPRGFTLVETLVAIAIITLAITAPFITITSSIILSYSARDDLVASALAQEGIEQIIAIRDDDFLANPTGSWWNLNMKINGTSCMYPSSCVYPPSQSALNRFTRTIQVTPTIASQEDKIVVTVTWVTERVSHTLTVTDYIEKWL